METLNIEQAAAAKKEKKEKTVKPPAGETLNIDQAAAAIGFSKMTLRRVMKSDPAFPRPVRIGLRRVAWIKFEIEAWLRSRPRA